MMSIETKLVMQWQRGEAARQASRAATTPSASAVSCRRCCAAIIQIVAAIPVYVRAR